MKRYTPTIDDPARYLQKVKDAAERGELITALGLADDLEEWIGLQDDADRTKVLADDLHAIVEGINRKVSGLNIRELLQ